MIFVAPTAPSFEDRIAISAVIARLSLAIDQQEWDAAEAALTEEVRSDYVCLFGGEPQVQSRTALVDGWRNALPGFHGIQHLVVTADVVMTGLDQARARSNVRATHRMDEALWTVAGVYTHDLVRVAGDWRIASVTLALAYEEGDRGLIAAAVERAKTLN